MSPPNSSDLFNIPYFYWLPISPPIPTGSLDSEQLCSQYCRTTLKRSETSRLSRALSRGCLAQDKNTPQPTQAADQDLLPDPPEAELLLRGPWGSRVLHHTHPCSQTQQLVLQEDLPSLVQILQ